MPDDKTLVENTLKGDLDSFSFIVNKYQNQIYCFLIKLTSNKEDSEELLQDVFIRAYRYLYRFNSKYNFSTWIYKIAVNAFRDYYKKKKKHEIVQIQIEEVFCDDVKSLEEEYEKKEVLREVLIAINTLKKGQKEALILKYIKGFNYREIGEVLKISSENAKVRVNRARKSLVKKCAGGK